MGGSYCSSVPIFRCTYRGLWSAYSCAKDNLALSCAGGQGVVGLRLQTALSGLAYLVGVEKEHI